MINITIPGQPVAKGRPRVSFMTKRTYTPEKTVSYENLIKTVFSEKYPDHIPWDVPLAVNIILSMQIPSSWSKKKQESAINYNLLPVTKPDIDNCVKAICDALNGIAWRDDSVIVQLQVIKVYSIAPSTQIIALPLKDLARNAIIRFPDGALTYLDKQND